MIVVDASAIVELLVASKVGAQVAERLRGEDLHAPAHVDAEVVGALRRAVLGARMSRHEAADAGATLNELSIRRWDLRPMSNAAFEHLDTLTVADAYYVVLAEALEAPLITCDGALSRSHGHDAVFEFAPYG